MNALVKFIAVLALISQLNVINVLNIGPTFNEVSEQKAVVVGNVDEPVDISEETFILLNEKLVKPYQSKNKPKSKLKSFSRCPSGYSPQVEEMASTVTEYSYGVMSLWEGCEPTDICSFRVRLSDKAVDILQSDSVNYVTVDLWLQNSTSSIR